MNMHCGVKESIENDDDDNDDDDAGKKAQGRLYPPQYVWKICVIFDGDEESAAFMHTNQAPIKPHAMR